VGGRRRSRSPGGVREHLEHLGFAHEVERLQGEVALLERALREEPGDKRLELALSQEACLQLAFELAEVYERVTAVGQKLADECAAGVRATREMERLERRISELSVKVSERDITLRSATERTRTEARAAEVRLEGAQQSAAVARGERDSALDALLDLQAEMVQLSERTRAQLANSELELSLQIERAAELERVASAAEAALLAERASSQNLSEHSRGIAAELERRRQELSDLHSSCAALESELRHACSHAELADVALVHSMEAREREAAKFEKELLGRACPLTEQRLFAALDELASATAERDRLRLDLAHAHFTSKSPPRPVAFGESRTVGSASVAAPHLPVAHTDAPPTPPRAGSSASPSSQTHAAGALLQLRSLPRPGLTVSPRQGPQAASRGGSSHPSTLSSPRSPRSTPSRHSDEHKAALELFRLGRGSGGADDD